MTSFALLVLKIVAVSKPLHWSDELFGDLEIFAYRGGAEQSASAFVHQFVPNGVLFIYSLGVLSVIRKRANLTFDDFLPAQSAHLLLLLRVLVWTAMVCVQLFIVSVASYVYFTLFSVSVCTMLATNDRQR